MAPSRKQWEQQLLIDNASATASHYAVAEMILFTALHATADISSPEKAENGGLWKHSELTRDGFSQEGDIDPPEHNCGHDMNILVNPVTRLPTVHRMVR